MAKKEKEVKTNAMRILEKLKIPFEVKTYECDEFVDGMHIADQLGQPYAQSFKTLVMQGKSRHMLSGKNRLRWFMSKTFRQLPVISGVAVHPLA